MSTTVTYSIHPAFLRDQLDRFADEVESPFPRKALQEVADFLVLGMVTRTSNGRDYRDRPFTPYSESYAEVRELGGRNVDPVDLTWTGKMLNALDSTVLPDGTIAVFFNNTERGQIAFYHNADLKDWPAPRKKIPQRRFVDLDPDGHDADRAKDVLARAKARQLQGR